LPGSGEYDRGERKQLGRELRWWLAGSAIVVLFTLLSFVVYAVLLVRSGWHG